MADGEIGVTVTAEDQASSILDGIAQGIEIAFGEKLLEFVGGAFDFVKEQLGELVSEAAAAEDTTALFNSVLANSPLKQYGAGILSLAEAYSKTTRFSDENIKSAETVILRYKEIGITLFPKVMKVTLDMATEFKTTAEGAAQQLGKALADIAGGSLSLLGRTRLLTKEQKDMATEMAKSGNVIGAQNYVLGIMDGQMKNAAETMGQTFNGAVTILGNSLNEFREQQGQKLLNLFTPLVEKVQVLAEKYLPVLAEMFDKFLVPAIQSVLDVLVPLLDTVLPALVDIIENLGKTTINWSNIFGDISTIFQGFMMAVKSIPWGQIWDDFVKGIAGFVDAIQKADWGTIIKTFLDQLGVLGESILTWFRAQNWNAISASISGWFIHAIGGVNWETVGHYIGSGLKFLANLLIELLRIAFTQVDTKGIMVALAYMFTGIIKGALDSAFADTASVWQSNFDQMGIAWANSMAGWGAFFNGIVATVQQFIADFQAKWMDGFGKLWDLAIKTWTLIKTQFSTFIAFIVGVVTNGISGMAARALATMLQFAAGIASSIGTITSNFMTGVDDWINSITSRIGDFVQVGADLLQAIWDGVTSRMGDFLAFLAGIIQQAVAAALAALGITGQNQSTNQSAPLASSDQSAPRRGGGKGAAGGGNVYNFGPVTQNFTGKPNTSAYGAG